MMNDGVTRDDADFESADRQARSSRRLASGLDRKSDTSGGRMGRVRVGGAGGAGGGWGTWGVGGVLLVVLVLVSFWPGMRFGFTYDDHPAILQNPTIERLSAMNAVLSPPAQTPVAGRPVVNLTLALNYAMHGHDPLGYHLFNLGVHVVSVLLVWSIVRRTLAWMASEHGRKNGWINGGMRRGMRGGVSGGVAGLWGVHPLQTETVVYATQRTELLFAMFLLLTMDAAGRVWNAKTSRQRAGWSVVAIVACAIGMGCKEVMLVTPVLMVLYHRAFVSEVGPAGEKSWGEKWRNTWQREWVLFVGLMLTGLVWLGLMWGAPRSGSVGWGHGVSMWDYLRMQAQAIAMYMRLAVWPMGLSIAHADPSVEPWWVWALPGAMIVMLLCVMVYAWARQPRVGFLLAWFFILLAPTSSFVPIVTEVVAERRMYLPLLAMVVAFVWLIRCHRADRTSWVIYGLVLAMCVGMTWVRLRDYRDEISLWASAVRVSPNSARALNGLGMAYGQAGEPAAAIEAFEQAIALRPNFFEAHNNLGVAYDHQGDAVRAIGHFEMALRSRDDDALTHENLGAVRYQLGEFDRAARHFGLALEYGVRRPGLVFNLATALDRAGRLDESLKYYEESVANRPGHAAWRAAYGTTLARLGRYVEAASQLRQVLAIDPGNAIARDNLAILESAQTKPQ